MILGCISAISAGIVANIATTTVGSLTGIEAVATNIAIVTTSGAVIITAFDGYKKYKNTKNINIGSMFLTGLNSGISTFVGTLASSIKPLSDYVHIISGIWGSFWNNKNLEDRIELEY